MPGADSARIDPPRLRRGQANRETDAALVGIVFDPDAAAVVLLDDPQHERQPETPAATLRRVTRLPDAAAQRRWNSFAGVGDADLDRIAGSGSLAAQPD